MISLLSYSGSVLVLLLSLTSAKDITKPPLPDLKGASIDQGLRAHLPSTAATWIPWVPTYIPNDCKKLGAIHNFTDASKFEVFNVNYADCDTAWTFCRHVDSPMKQIEMVDTFGKVPVGMRSFVTHIISVPGEVSALNYGGPIVLFGEFRLDELVHEVAHSIDAEYLTSGTSLGGAWFSESKIWLNNYALDSAVWDSYATTNQAENFAQETVIALYDKNVPGGILAVQPLAKKIYHQYSTIQLGLGKKMLPGGKCGKRLPDSPYVKVVDSAKFRARRSWFGWGKRDLDLGRYPITN